MTSDDDTLVTLTAIVSGRVQGVGFRYFVLTHAQHLGLSGWVRNRADRSVEVVARGSRAAIDALRAYLRQGPRSSRVADISEDWSERDQIPASFEIR